MKAVAVLAILLGHLSASPQQNSSLEALLRLKPGNYWVYRGTAFSDHSKFPVTWKIEILEEATHDALHAYLVRGGFLDLAWFDKYRSPRSYVWIISKDRFYVLDASPELLKSFHDPKDTLQTQIASEEPLIELPLTPSTCTRALHPAEEIKRDDLFYCWHFEDKTSQKLTVRGISQQRTIVWNLVYRTNPDHQILGFAPGIGFVSYDFAHHGTPAEAHVKLLEAHLK